MKHVRTAFFALLSLFAWSCTDPAVGLWASLQDEELVSNDSTKAIAKVSPTSVARFGSRYYLAFGGDLMRRGSTLKAEAWKAADMPKSDDRATLVAATDDALYAAFTTDTFSPKGIWRSTDGSHWGKTGAPDSDPIDGLWILDGVPYAAVRTHDAKWNVAFCAPADTANERFASSLFADDLSEMPKALASDGTAVMTVTQSKVYLDDAEISGVSGMPDTDAETIESVLWDGSDDYGTGGRYIVTSSDGNLYACDSAGANWKTLAVETDTGSSPALSGMAIVPDGSRNYLLAGTMSTPKISGTTTSAAGFMTVKPGSGTLADAKQVDDRVVCSENNFQTTVGTEAISGFSWIELSGGDGILFAMVPANGLWSSRYVSGAWKGFEKE